MNITLENVDKVSAVLTVNIEKADYAEKVTKSLKKIRQNAQMPGFRKGMVPMGLIQKQYGVNVKAEEINKIMQEAIYSHIKDNKVNILGEPLPQQQSELDIEKDENFAFKFDIALAPEFKATLTGRDSVDYYTIEVTDEMVDQQVHSYTQRAGSHENVESYEDKDMVKGTLAELDENGNPKEGGILVEGAVMLPNYFKNDEQKAKFNGAKVDDVVTFNPSVAYDGSEIELSSLLKISKEEAANVKNDFTFQLKEIKRFKEAELSQEIFDQVFGKDTVKSEEEFRAKIKEQLAQQFVADSDYKFMVDVREHMLKKVGKLEFPDELLKKIMKLNNQDKAEDYVEKNYEKSLEELTWHLVKEQLVEANSIKVDDADLKETAKQATKAQFIQYGMMNIPEEILENYATEMLKKRENIDGLVNRCIEDKLAKALKAKVKLNEKTVSIDEFGKMFA